MDELNEILFKFVIAISLGALMGLERDGNWRKKGSSKKSIDEQSKSAAEKFSFINSAVPAHNLGGVRTYVLISVMGAMTGLLYSHGIESIVWVVTLGLFLFIQIAFVLNYFDKNTLGLTTEISIIINFLAALSLFATDIPMKVVVAIVVFSVFVMSIRQQLHNVVSKFSRKEIVDTTKFILFSLVILPFLPDINYGLEDLPLLGEQFSQMFSDEFLTATAVLNPYKLWLVVVFVMSVSFVGYFATKILDKSRGINLVGLLGGLVSSTAVTEAMALQSRKTKSKETKRNYIMAAVLANIASFIRTVFVASVINISLALYLIIPLGAMSLVLGGWAFQSNLRNKARNIKTIKKESIEDMGVNFHSPFSMKTALAFGGLFLLVSFFSSVVLYLLGDSGFFVYSMIVSMTGIDPVTINTAKLLEDGSITMYLAILVLVTAVCVNLLVKLVFAAISGDLYFRKKISKVFIGSIVAGVIGMLLVVGFLLR
jgi:uncharacterized membrane protein (DUF4010 family)